MDREGVENFARAMGIGSGSYDNFTLEMLALGAGAMPIIGTREQVAEKLAKLYLGGLDGMLLVFLSYLEDTVRFQREILPPLEQLGVRWADHQYNRQSALLRLRIPKTARNSWPFRFFWCVRRALHSST